MESDKLQLLLPPLEFISPSRSFEMKDVIIKQVLSFIECGIGSEAKALGLYMAIESDWTILFFMLRGSSTLYGRLSHQLCVSIRTMVYTSVHLNSGYPEANFT